jgi:hypothetical protein
VADRAFRDLRWAGSGLTVSWCWNAHIAAHLLSRCGALEQFDAYMFGSTLRGVGEDIDILVFGPGGDALSRLKRELRAEGEFLPLHILYMQPSEERRTDFVARENCVPLVQLTIASGN